jgi:UDP-N-acetylglucosamine 2-epimerase (non-hydrolysing)
MRAGPVAVVLGTRPEAIKLWSLVEHLGDRALVVHTGQHYDAELAADVASDLRLRAPDLQLQLGGLRRGEQIGSATAALSRVFAEHRPAAAIVQGDTSSALAGALAANAEGVPLVHVEAGLRSFDRAMPEEHHRVLIDHLADLCAAPTSLAVQHLQAEAIPPERIELTGNTVVEAVLAMAPTASRRAHLLERLGLSEHGFVLATIHRPENTDDPTALAAILRGLADLAAPVVLPLHPRTRARTEQFGLSALLAPLTVLPPVPPSDFLGLASSAGLVVSDSGGVQEEAAVLKFRVLVVRRSTERPEALGTFAELVGPETVARRGNELLEDRDHLVRLRTVDCPFGDGSASRRIAALVADLLGVGLELVP